MLRRAKNVKNAPEAERDALLKDAERLEDLCVKAVFAGIGLEALLAFAPLALPVSAFVAGLGNTIADAAVALGVLGELRFGNVVGAILKAKLTDAYVLAVLADGKAASASSDAARATEELAKANERAAKLEKEAQELRLKATEAGLRLRRMSNPRHPDREILLRKLSGQPKPSKIDVLYSMDGADCATLSTWIAAFLKDAGWPVDPPHALSIPPSAVLNLTASQMVGGQPWGITILDPDIGRSGGPSRALADALVESMGDHLVCITRASGVVTGALRVIVAPRP